MTATTTFTDVCRICPYAVRDEDLFNIFDTKIFVDNIQEVLLVTTGVKVLENDVISKKICQKCCYITSKMFEFRQDAQKQDRVLKERLNHYLQNKGIMLPNTVQVNMKRPDSNETKMQMTAPLNSEKDIKTKLHPTVAQIYKSYPHLKLPKKCIDRHLAPVVSLPMGYVEWYFKNKNLDLKKFIYKPGSKVQPINIVTQKETDFPTKHKTVTPLKISKKVPENIEQPGSSNANYVCTPLPKKKRGRKRKIPLTDNDNGPKVMLPKKKRGRKRKIPLNDNDDGPKVKVPNTNIKITSQSTTSCQSVTETPKPGSPKKHDTIKSPMAAHVPAIVSRTTELILPATSLQIDTIKKDSSESSTPSSFKTASISGLGKPNVESLGLTPRIVTTKSHTLLTCNVCGSVHQNAIELKCHSRKHMVCQFCKRRFKSVEAKKHHVDNFCNVKKIMNSSGLVVALERVHLNLDVRQKYMDAFSTFDPIPGLVEPAPLEHVMLEAVSPLAAGDTFVISDDEHSIGPGDPLSGIPTPSADMPSPLVEKGIYKYIAIIRPDLRIKNNTILDRLAVNKSDKEMIKDLTVLVKPEKPVVCEQILQTDLPDTKDIKINNTKGTCQFNNLNEQLLTYVIPIKISNGHFKVSYQYDKHSKSTKSMACWDDIPIIEQYKKISSKQTISSSQNKTVATHNGSLSLSTNTFLSSSSMTDSNLQVKSTKIDAGLSTAVSVTTTAIPAFSPFSTMPIKSVSLPMSSKGVTTSQSVSPNETIFSSENRTVAHHNGVPTNALLPACSITGLCSQVKSTITNATSSTAVSVTTTAIHASSPCSTMPTNSISLPMSSKGAEISQIIPPNRKICSSESKTVTNHNERLGLPTNTPLSCKSVATSQSISPINLVVGHKVTQTTKIKFLNPISTLTPSSIKYNDLSTAPPLEVRNPVPISTTFFTKSTGSLNPSFNNYSDMRFPSSVHVNNGITEYSSRENIVNNSNTRSPASVDAKTDTGRLIPANIPSQINASVIVSPASVIQKTTIASESSAYNSEMNSSLIVTPGPSASAIEKPFTDNGSLSSNSHSTIPSAPPVKFRVKKVWELQ